MNLSSPDGEREETAPTPAKAWADKIIDAERRAQKWLDQCRNCDKLYAKVDRADAADREYSLFWANLEVLRPAVYARPPVPVVAPRFKDGNALSREASETLERALIVSHEQADIDGLMKEVRDDFLRYARGTAWVRLAGQADRIEFDHVCAEDFVHDPGRTWREVKWVARRAWLTRDEGVARFGEVFKSVELKKRDPEAAIPDREDKAPIWEVWCKSSRKVYWLNCDFPDMLDVQDPFLDLSEFWPCPKPAYGTLVPKTLRPVPEVVQYKDQIEEVNEYTARIAALSEALRMKGFYPAGAGDLSEAIEAAIKNTDNRAILVPISSVAGLGAGGFKDSIVWLPVTDVATLVQTLVELRRVVIEDVYQITGISDIVRGASDAGETATAQQIKSQWGSLRIRERQGELIRFARDLTRISAEIMAESFAPGVIFEMAQSQLPTAAMKQQATMAVQQAEMAQQPPPKDAVKALKQPTMEEVAQFLANDRARGFVIEIETDSTIQPDEDAEKQRRTEFAQVVGGLFAQALPVGQAMPPAVPLILEVLKFTAAGFRAGRSLEASIDDFAEKMQEVAETPPPPDPAIAAQEMEQQAKAEELGMKREEMGMKLEFEREKMALEREKMAMQQAQMAEEFAFKREAAVADREMSRELEQAKLQDSKAARSQELEFKRAEKGLAARETDDGEQETVAAEDVRTDKTNAVLAQLSEAMQGMAAGFERIGEGFESLAKAQAAPKRVVRGPDGRAVGTETVMN
jgi:hypothetical protein